MFDIDPLYISGSTIPPLQSAISGNHIHIIEYLLSRDHSLTFTQDLFQSQSDVTIETVAYILDHCTEFGYTYEYNALRELEQINQTRISVYRFIMIVACRQGSVPIARLVEQRMLEHLPGVDMVHVTNQRHYRSAVMKGDVEFLDLYIRWLGVLPALTFQDFGESSVNLEMAQWMVSKYPTKVSEYLAVCILYGNLDVVKFLHERGYQSEEEMVAAMECGGLAMVQYLYRDRGQSLLISHPHCINLYSVDILEYLVANQPLTVDTVDISHRYTKNLAGDRRRMDAISGIMKTINLFTSYFLIDYRRMPYALFKRYAKTEE
eukprot:gene442-527_t